MSSLETKPQPPTLSEGLKGLVSLAIILHLCCVLTVLASNFRRSAVLNELVSLFSLYTQPLNLDPDRTPYFFTHGEAFNDDAVLAVDLYPSADAPLARQQLLSTVTLPDRGSRWLESRRRYLALANVVQANSPTEGEPTDYEADVTITIAQGVARRLMEEHQCRRAVVRCVRRMSQPRALADPDPGFPPDDPFAPQYEVTVFTADVWIDDDGITQGARRAARGELAPLRPEGSQ